MTDLEPGIDTADRVNEFILPSPGLVNCLHAAPNTQFISLLGNTKHVIRDESDLSLLVQPQLRVCGAHAASPTGTFAFLVNRRVAVLDVNTQELCTSKDQILFDPSDMAVSSSKNGRIVAVVGVAGAFLWRWKEGCCDLEGQTVISGTQSHGCTHVAISNATVAVSSEDGIVSIWDNIAETIWNKEQAQFSTETVFNKSMERTLSDQITEITFSDYDGFKRLAVVWWSGCIEVYQRDEQWSQIWAISKKDKAFVRDIDVLGTVSAGSFAVFAAQSNSLAMNGPDGTIRFLRSSDGKLVQEVFPEEGAGEVKGLAATGKGVLVWNRGVSSLRRIDWPSNELALVGECSEPSPFKCVELDGNTVEPKEREDRNSTLLQVLDATIYHMKRSGKLQVRFPQTGNRLSVYLPLELRTLRILNGERSETNPAVLEALDVFATYRVVGIVLSKAIVIFRANENSWNHITCNQAIERGAVSVDREFDRFGVIAGVTSRGELWRWNIHSLATIDAEPLVLLGPVFSIIGCTSGSGTFAVLGWRMWANSCGVDKSFSGTYGALVLPERGKSGDVVVQIRLPCMANRLPECILGLWNTQLHYVILFQFADEQLVATAYCTSSFDFVESKPVMRKPNQTSLARIMAMQKIPDCFSVEPRG